MPDWKVVRLGLFYVAFIAGGHLSWKYLQDMGVGDKGTDYPIKNLPRITNEVITILKERKDGKDQ